MGAAKYDHAILCRVQRGESFFQIRFYRHRIELFSFCKIDQPGHGKRVRTVIFIIFFEQMMQFFFTNGNRGCQHQHPLPGRHLQGRLHGRLHPDKGNMVSGTKILNRHRCRRIAGDNDPLRPLFQKEAHLRIGIETHLRLLLRSVRRMFRICIEQKSLPRQATHRFIQNGETADSGVKNPNGLLFHLIAKVVWSFVSSYRQSLVFCFLLPSKPSGLSFPLAFRAFPYPTFRNLLAQ